MNESSTESKENDCPEALANQASERFQWHWEERNIAGEIRKLAVASDPEGMLIDACERQDAGEKDVIDPFWDDVNSAPTALNCAFSCGFRSV